jgi:hypothetical protein
MPVDAHKVGKREELSKRFWNNMDTQTRSKGQVLSNLTDQTSIINL